MRGTSHFGIGLFIAAEIADRYKATGRLFVFLPAIKITNAYNQ